MANQVKLAAASKHHQYGARLVGSDGRVYVVWFVGCSWWLVLEVGESWSVVTVWWLWVLAGGLAVCVAVGSLCC